MRKVYQSEKSSSGLAMAVLIGVGVAGVVFGILPFSHMIAKPSSLKQLRQASATDMPPPVEQEAPPPAPEPEKPPEAQPEPQLAEAPQQIQLTAVLEVPTGGGGALAGFGEFKKLAVAESVDDKGAFDVQELEKRPEPVSQIAPAYPKELSKAKIEGLVTLVFLLSEEGRVEDARVENSTRPEFEKPALDAVRKWRFRPGQKDGKPVRTYIRYPIRFRVPAG